jgi:dipeptidyl aminopeptidase/acylaminoacyl peptidase
MEFTTSQAEVAGVLVVSVPSYKIFSVFARQTVVSHVVAGEYGAAQVGGHWYGFFGGITNRQTSENNPYLDHTYPDLYRVDLDTGDAERIANGSPIGDGWLVGPDGEVIARAVYNEEGGDWQVLAGLHVGRVLASGHSPFGGAGLSRGRTADTLLVSHATDKGVVVEEISLSDGKPVETPNDDEIHSRIFDRKTNLWIGYTMRGDQPAIKMFDQALEKRVVAARKAFPNQTLRLESTSEDFNRLLVFTTGGDDSGTCWIVDIATGQARPVGYEYPTVHPDQIGPIRMVEWKAADGMVIHGVLSLPAGRSATNLPVVVLPHGGPQARDYPVFDWWAQAFASRGYAVFQPNFRGSAGYGAAFRDAGFREWGRKMQTDVSDGLAELGREGIVDPRRACIVGGSYGGYAALAGVTLQHGLYRCAVSVAGVADPANFLTYAKDRTGRSSSVTRYWQAFMGPTVAFDQISPLRQAAQADAPILLIHGKDDTVVPFDQSTSMQRALAAAGKPVEMVVMPSEDHWLSREATRILMLTSATAFIEKYNPPDKAD